MQHQSYLGSALVPLILGGILLPLSHTTAALPRATPPEAIRVKAKSRLLAAAPRAATQAQEPEKGKSRAPGKSRPQGADTDTPVFNWEGRQLDATAVLSDGSFSGTTIGGALSIIFDGASVSLQGPSSPLHGTWTGTIRIPLLPGAKQPGGLRYMHFIRGGVTKDKDARVVIFVDAGGKTSVIEYPYGRKTSSEIMRNLPAGVLSGGEDYSVTFLVVVERRNINSAVLVSLDSLDVNAGKSAQRPSRGSAGRQKK